MNAVILRETLQEILSHLAIDVLAEEYGVITHKSGVHKIRASPNTKGCDRKHRNHGWEVRKIAENKGREIA